MVLPGMESSWLENKPKWFVIDESCIDQLREPGESQLMASFLVSTHQSKSILGLLKSEFSMTSGSAIFLSPKCYLMHNGDDNDEKGTKRALKGVNHSTNVSREDFIDALYENKIAVRRQVRFKRDPKVFKTRLVEEQRRALNPIYYKMKVSDDFVTCAPHM